MEKIRIGDDIIVKFKVNAEVDGVSIDLSTLTLKVIVYDPYGNGEAVSHSVSGSTVTFRLNGAEHQNTGIYRITVWAFSGDRQAAMDIDDAFELVDSSENETNIDGSKVEVARLIFLSAVNGYIKPSMILREWYEYDENRKDGMVLSAGLGMELHNIISNLEAGGTGGGGTISDKLFEEKLAIFGKKHFLSKLNDDTASGRITFAKSADFGQFVSGIVGGIGGRIDSKGNAELESLVLRSFLEVPELRFNRIDVVSGELWNSIAFGTIASVTVDANGTGGTAWVHLEETERCGLKVGDICRGIFSDLGEGRPTDEDEDSNGFLKTYGFSTSYFTPTAIISNEEGEFGFRYSLQAGTTCHPCEFMKFAVYGSFSDPSRRASAYFTRSYMRYLKNVQTWQIDPDKNIASQFGNLDGLTIGGMHMQGEGTFLSNIYMTGAIIQFTPEQKEELKGQDAYSVVLSDYECVLHVTSDGFVKDINKIRNVIVNGSDVMAMKDGKVVKVVDLGYNATAAVQVYKGKDRMHHAPIVGESAYTIVPSFHNCEGVVTNGVLIVTKVVDTELDAYVDLEINCEGNALFDKHFAITVVKDASSPVTVDLDNEMDTVVENPLTGEIIGSPLTTTAMMRYGTDDMEIVLMSDVEPLPDGIRVSIEGSTASVDVGKEAGETSAITLRVVGKTAVSETLHTREVRFIVNKVRSQYQLKLVPSVAEVKVDADGTFNGSTTAMVKCQALVNDGTASVIPATYAELKGYSARMFYGINVTSDVPDFSAEVTEEIYANGVNVSSSDDSVTFWLYYYPNGIDTESGRVRFDMETIHVLHDAADSLTQFVFKRSNAESVAAPEGGTYSSSIPAGWSDGVPAGEAKLWMSRRKFTSNGKNQDKAWSTPRPMTDTADFDVCFHDAIPGDGEPTAPPKDMHPTQTGITGNNGWYDLGKESSEWMAMATCSNGVWSEWSVVKIVGESPVIADIDNEMDGIGVGSDGVLDVATTTSTNVFMYHGSSLMYIRSVSASGLPPRVTASASFPSDTDHSQCKVTFDIDKGADFSVKSHHAIVLTIVATYNDVDYTRSLTYTLLGTTNGKDGEVYYLQPSTTAVTRDKDLVYHPTSLTCARYVKKGVSEPEVSNEGVLEMSTNGGDSFVEYEEISSFSDIKTVIYRWMLNGTEVDRETVPVIFDGESALSLQVSQTQGSVQLTNDGALITTSVFLIEVKAFFGLEKEPITSDPSLTASKNGIALSVTSRSGNKATVQLTISGTGGMDSSDNVVVNINVPTNRGTLSFDFSIQGVRQGKIGKIARYCGTFVEGNTYYGSADISGNYVDIVYHETKKAYLQCVIGGKYTTSQIVTNQDNSSSYNWLVSNFEFIATKVFFAELAHIRNLALVNMIAGYYKGNDFVRMIEIDGSGNLSIGNESNRINISDSILQIVSGSYMMKLSGGGIGRTDKSGDGFSLYGDLLKLYNTSDQLEIEPNRVDLVSKSKATTWEKIIDAANGTRIKVVSSLPSTTEANVLYVVI